MADGEILAPDGRATSYWELADDGLLDRPATGGYPPKPASGVPPGRHQRAPAGPAGQAHRPAPVRPRPGPGRPVLRPGRPPARARRDAGRPRPDGRAGPARRARGGAGRQLPRRGRRARGGRAARRRPAARRRRLGVPPDAAGRRGPAGLPGLGGRRDHRAGRARRAPGPRPGRPRPAVPCRGHVPPPLPRARVHGAVHRHRPGQRPGDQAAPGRPPAAGVVAHPGRLPAPGRTRPCPRPRRRTTSR